MKKIIIYILLMLLPLLSAPAVAIASAEFEDIPDYILLRNLLPHLKAIDLFRLDQVSGRYHQVMQNDNAWKSVVGRHTPPPITEWLVGQYKYATKCMLNNKTYIEFPKSVRGEVFCSINATDWSGSVIGGAAIPILEKKSNSHTFSACIFTEQHGMQFLKNLEQVGNSSISAVNHNGSSAIGRMKFDQEAFGKAFTWNQQDGMQAILSTDDNIYINETLKSVIDWSGNTGASSYDHKILVKKLKEIIHPSTDFKAIYANTKNWDGTALMGIVEEVEESDDTAQAEIYGSFFTPSVTNSRIFKWSSTNDVKVFNDIGVKYITSANYDISMAIVSRHSPEHGSEHGIWTEADGFQSSRHFGGTCKDRGYIPFFPLILSSDGQIMVGFSHKTDHKRQDLMLYNITLSKCLSFNDLFDQKLPCNFKFKGHWASSWYINLWGNVILGTGRISDKMVGYRLFIPRQDFLDKEGIPYKQPDWFEFTKLKPDKKKQNVYDYLNQIKSIFSGMTSIQR